METHLGDIYFDTRARLGTAIHDLSKLAADAQIHPSKLALLDSLLANLKEPFLFVVTGEVNAGKSTLLNALFGHEFCEVGVIPTTAKIHLFKHGEEPHDIPVSDTVEELYRTNEFLKDFNIVDTPGTNSIEENHQEITERFIPMADVVIFTFSVTNPWAASAWTLLKKIKQDWYKNIMFALQQCDVRDQEEIDAIIEHLKVTAQQKLGAQFPIFQVSGKQAFLAKTTALDKERLWQESGFEKFERHISESVNSPAIRENKLGNLSRSARVILAEVKEQLAAGARILKADEELLSGLGTEVSQQRARTLDKFNGFLRSLDSDYVELTIAGTGKLHDRLGFGATLGGFFRKEGTPAEIEQDMIEGLSKSATAQVDEATSIVEDDLVHLWRQLADKMQDHFNFKLRVGNESGLPEWTTQREHMRQRLVSTIEEQLPKLMLAKLLNRRIVARRWANLIFGLGSLLAVIGGAAAYWLKLVPENNLGIFGVVIAAIVVAAFICGSIFSRQSMESLVNKLGSHFENHRSELSLALRNVLTEEVNGFFEDFIQLFGPLHQLCDEHRAQYAPQVEQLEKVSGAFDEVDLLIGLDPVDSNAD